MAQHSIGPERPSGAPRTVIAGVAIGLIASAAALAGGGGGGTHTCKYCHTYPPGGSSQYCDEITCPEGSGCSGEACKANETIVRACCGACSTTDGWQAHCNGQ